VDLACGLRPGSCARAGRRRSASSMATGRWLGRGGGEPGRADGGCRVAGRRWPGCCGHRCRPVPASPSSRRWQPELDPRQPEQGHGGRGAFCDYEV
jgi:hypothetical protein